MVIDWQPDPPVNSGPAILKLAYQIRIQLTKVLQGGQLNNTKKAKACSHMADILKQRALVIRRLAWTPSPVSQSVGSPPASCLESQS